MKSTVEMLLPKKRFLLFVNRNTVLFFDGEVYHSVRESICIRRGLLDRSTARYVYKRLKASLRKPTGNLLENLFSKKCVLKNNLQLLGK